MRSGELLILADRYRWSLLSHPSVPDRNLIVENRPRRIRDLMVDSRPRSSNFPLPPNLDDSTWVSSVSRPASLAQERASLPRRAPVSLPFELSSRGIESPQNRFYLRPARMKSWGSVRLISELSIVPSSRSRIETYWRAMLLAHWLLLPPRLHREMRTPRIIQGRTPVDTDVVCSLSDIAEKDRDSLDSRNTQTSKYLRKFLSIIDEDNYLKVHLRTRREAPLLVTPSTMSRQSRRTAPGEIFPSVRVTFFSVSAFFAVTAARISSRCDRVNFTERNSVKRAPPLFPSPLYISPS